MWAGLMPVGRSRELRVVQGGGGCALISGLASRQRWQPVVSMIVAAFALASCVSDRDLAADPFLVAAQHQTDKLVREAQRESASLRADLAASQLTVSRQQGELSELRRRQAEFLQNQTELGKSLQAKQEEAVMLRIERDALKKAQEQAAKQPGEAGRLQETLSSIEALGANLMAKMRALETSLVTLKEELADVRRDRQVKVKKDGPSRAQGEGLHPVFAKQAQVRPKEGAPGEKPPANQPSKAENSVPKPPDTPAR